VPTPSSTLTSGPDGPEPINFAKPDFAPAIQVATDSIPASSRLPFPAAFPTNTAGTPATVWASSPANYPQGEAMVAASWDSRSQVGPFFLFEYLQQPGQMTESDIQALGANCSDCTENGIITVAAGIDGALLAGPPTNSITWLQGNYELEVMGPADTFSVTDAKTAAAEIAKAFAQTAASVTTPATTASNK
jgi:hypothetical protein